MVCLRISKLSSYPRMLHQSIHMDTGKRMKIRCKRMFLRSGMKAHTSTVVLKHKRVLYQYI